MRELFLLVVMLLVLSGPALAGTVVTGTKVTFAGEEGKPGPVQVVAGKPGVRFGLELVPEGSPPGAPVVLEVRLLRPGDSEDAPSPRWLVAARVGQPAACLWEFAYDWEVKPGVWTMTVSHESVVLATEPFTVTREESQIRPQDKDNKAPEPVKAADAVPDRGSLKTADTGPQARKSPAESESSLTKQPVQPNGKRLVGGQPDRRVYALIGGTYSEEDRALWMASLLKNRGVQPCVRIEERGGRRLWSLVAGWRDSLEEAKEAKQKLAPLMGDMVVVPMTAGNLEKGLQCR